MMPAVIPRRAPLWGAVVAVTLAAAAPARGEPAKPDYSGYQALLDAHLQVVSAKDAPLETVFDYTALYRSPERKRTFALIREQLFGVSPAALDERERLAWAINAHNYLAIEAATNHLYEGTQRINKGGKRYFFALRIATVNTIDLDGFTFPEAPMVDIDGASYSLNGLARTFVFRGFDAAGGAKTPAGLDPRAHFALVGATKGHPTLLPRAYRGDSLDAQLDFAVRNALANPRHLRFNPEVGRLEASSIFDWHHEDFGGRDAAFAFVKKYAPRAIRDQIEERKVPWISAYLLWSPDLNHPEGGNEKPWEVEERGQEVPAPGRSGH